MTSPVSRYQAWTARHALALNTLLMVVFALELVLVLTVSVLQSTEANKLERQSLFAGGLWGVIYVLCIQSLAKAWSARRRITKPARLPVNPADPPSPGVFARDPEDPEVLCYCHNLPVTDGQNIICWPQPPKYTCDTTEASK